MGFFSPSPPGPAHRCPVAGRRRKQRRKDPRHIPGNPGCHPAGWSRLVTDQHDHRSPAGLSLFLWRISDFGFAIVFFSGAGILTRHPERFCLGPVWQHSLLATSFNLCNCPVSIEFYYPRFSDAG